jgi:hypothetical protein
MTRALLLGALFIFNKKRYSSAQGPLAHLVERLICNEEVTGSIPVGST